MVFSLSKRNVHPNAVLPNSKNMSKGIEARSLILTKLEGQELVTRDIMALTKMSYSRVLYHLSLLRKHMLVKKKGSKRGKISWALSGLGQQQIVLGGRVQEND